ncbi:hypothetical protein V8B97DRAFT_1872028 [Scleroderma yunnanense]
MFNSLLSLFSAFVLAISYLAHAAPVKPEELLAFSPSIFYPTAGVVWPAGSVQNVTWRTDNIPDEVKNSTGLILLGYQTSDSENLDIKRPLASSFPITAGFVQFTVPSDLVYRTNYIVVLFGDSGNASPQFTITNSTQS